MHVTLCDTLPLKCHRADVGVPIPDTVPRHDRGRSVVAEPDQAQAEGRVLRGRRPTSYSLREIFDEDHMREAVKELKNKSVKDLRQQLADAGATHDQLEKIDDMRIEIQGQ